LLKSFKLRNLFLGKDTIASRAEYKRLMLTSYMSLTCIGVAIFYAIIDFVNQVYYAFPAYAVLFIMPTLTLLLLRNRRYKPAKIVLMLSSNLVVFWSAVNDPFETGAFMFFIPAGIGSFAILSVDDYETGFGLAALTVFLFFFAYFGNLHLVNAPRPSEAYITISFVVNYFISLTISVLAIFFLMNLNEHSENELIKKEMLANEKNAELMKVNAELDRFVYSVSHDLRSPLSSILGLTNLAQKTTDRAELDQILEMIRGRINTQDNFIRDIIDYARNARTEISTEPVILDQLVDEVFSSLQFNTHAEKITFKKNIPTNTLLKYDRIRLSIILSNLVSNAIKYHDIRKPTPYIEVGYREGENILYVRDNGIGIMQEHIDKIFNMFYRGSDRSSGSGLGLFITREAVIKLGGSIRVQSIYGEGSIFSIYFNNKA
jgi:signal transduction histidine kinase